MMSTEEKDCTMDLKTLVERAKAGDAEALEWMYGTFAPKMRMACIRMLQKEGDVVDDLVHDAFVLAYTQIGTLQDPDKLEAWLCTIVRNLARRYLNVRQMRATQPLSALQDESPSLADSSQTTDSHVLTAEILSAIDKLPSGYQNILRLHILEGYSHQEIATMLDIAPHSSSSQLSRAKSALRKIMAERKMWLVLITALLAIPIYKYFIGKDRTSIGDAGPEKKGYRADKARFTKEDNKTGPHSLSGQTGHKQIAKTVIRTMYPPQNGMAYTRTQTASGKPDTILVVPQDTVLFIPERSPLADINGHNDSVNASAPDTTRANPILNVPTYDFAETPTNGKKHGWTIGGLGILGSALSESAATLLTSTGNSITSEIPKEFDNWEAYNNDLLINNPQPDDKTRALLEIASHNSGDIVEHEDHEKPLTFGVSLAKTLGGRWSFDTGLQYTLLRSTFSTGSNGYSIDRKQKVHYLGIPLRMSYRLLRYKGLSGYATGGMTVNIPLYGNAKEYYTVNYESLQTDQWKLSPAWQWSLSTSIGLQYRLTPYLGLYVEPTLNYYIPTGSGIHTVWTEHPFTFSVPFGLRLTW